MPPSSRPGVDALMSLKFGSPIPPPSSTDTNASTTLLNENSSGSTSFSSIPAKPPPSLDRRALYPMTYEEAASNLHQVQCNPLSIPRPSRVLPGVEDMLKGVPPYLTTNPTSRSSSLQYDNHHPTSLSPPTPPSSDVLMTTCLNLSSFPRRRRRPFHHQHLNLSQSHLHDQSRSSMSSLQSPRQRVSIACTFCRARKLRCTPGPPPCEHCRRRSHPCKFDYQSSSSHRDQLPLTSSSSSSWISCTSKNIFFGCFFSFITKIEGGKEKVVGGKIISVPKDYCVQPTTFN